MNTTLETTLRRILAPLVKLLIAKSVQFGALQDLLKDLYVAQALRHFELENRKITDSRISLLTGLQRRDVHARRNSQTCMPKDTPKGIGPLPRIVARWSTAKKWTDDAGRPLVLPRKDPRRPSFESLVSEISRDIHPRTVLDQLREEGVVSLAPETDDVTLLTDSYLARDDAHLMAYLGANVGDHMEAAVSNVLASPSEAPFFERAVHYNQLSLRSVTALEIKARALQGHALAQLNRMAQTLQEEDRETPDSDWRFRTSAYIYRETEPHEETP